jgi:hypothetical protein
MTTALGVAPDANGMGLDPLTHRLLIKQHWNNTGVVMGLTVSGRGDLRYQVSAGAAICSMSAADGYTEAYWNGGQTENTVAAGDSTYSRIDVVYMLSNTGTTDNTVHVMVVQGTPSASPVAPSLPAGAQPLAYRLMPANGSTTNSATPYGNIDYAIPYSASLDRIGYQENTGSQTQDWRPDLWWSQAALTTQYLPMDRSATVRFVYRASSADEALSSFYARLKVDGQVMTDGLDECPVFPVWARQQVSFPIVLSGGRAHSVDVEVRPNTSRKAFTWRGLRYVEVVDVSVAR